MTICPLQATVLRLVTAALLLPLLAAGCASEVEPDSQKQIRPVDDSAIPQSVRTLAKDSPIALLEKALAAYRDKPITSYTCTFQKQEVVNGSLQPLQTMDVTFRGEPFSVAMVWTQNAPLADRLLYVKDKYTDEDGRSLMLVQPRDAMARWIVGDSLLRLPDGPDAMKNTRRPVTKFGFEKNLQSLLDVYRTARENGDLKHEYAGAEEVNGRLCVVLVRYLPEKDIYPAHETTIWLDAERLLPMRIEGRSWKKTAKGQFVFQSRYEFSDVHLNPDLADDAFTPQAVGIAPPDES